MAKDPEAHRAAQRRFAAKNPDKIKKWEKGRSKAVRNAWHRKARRERPGTWLYYSSLQGAKKKGLEFTLTRKQVEELVAPMVCSVSGMPLTTDERQGPWLPSLDRIDNAAGYVPGNVRLTCWMFNRAKAHWTDQQFMAMVQGIASKASNLAPEA